MPRVATLLPRDQDNAPIQVLCGSGNRVNLTAGAASSNSALPTGSVNMVIIRCVDYIWLNFGTGAVTASAANTSILCAPGEGAYQFPSTATHVAVLRAGAADVVVQVESLDSDG